jgi:hypothetical protein
MASISTFAAFSSRGYGFGGNSPIFPTGGDYVIEDVINNKRIHVFVNSGSFTVPTNINSNIGKFFSAEVLVVGGGGGAGNGGPGDYSGGAGGGGAGGAVVYDSAYTMVSGKAFSVTVGAAGGTNSSGGKSMFEGLPNAGGGGSGGSGDNFSMGGSVGGPGGGGSWVSGQPGGTDYSTANPGMKWGSAGPAAPAGTYVTDLTPTFFTAGSGQPSLAPLPSPNSSIVTIRRKGDIYGSSRGGYGNYDAASSAPDSTKGLAATGYYSTNGFRARGGGGAGYSGGYGGQGILTDFIDGGDGVTWRWILGGGSGWLPNNYEDIRSAPGGYIWRDSGVKTDGTYLANSFVQGASVDRWSTSRTTINDTNLSPAPWGSRQNGWNEGGGGAGWPDRGTDGSDGKLVIRYDLNSFPGGAPSATANVFGGNISTSSNGRFRYHTWTVSAPQGTSSNSMTYYINDSYRPRDTRNGNDATNEPTQWAQVTTQFGGSSAANTTPFYYNGDVPSFSYNVFLYGGGGASGTGPSGYDTSYMPGGGGAGGYQYLSLSSRAFTTNFSTLGTLSSSDLARYANSGSNVQSNDTDWGKLITNAMDLRPGFIEVYPNSRLNNKLEPRQYAYVSSGTNPITYYDPGTPTGNSRERNFRIKMRGDNVNKPGVVRRVYHTDLGASFFGNNDIGNGAADSRKYYYIYYTNTDNGNPPCQGGGWGDSFSTNSYDQFFYADYFRVRIGRYSREDEETKIADTNGNDTGNGDENNKDYVLGTWTGAFDLAYGDTRFAATATGTHPDTGETYYNCIRITPGLTRYENPKGSDSSQGGNFKTSSYYWSKFWSKVTSYGTGGTRNIWDTSTGGSQNDPNVWDHGYRTNYVANLTVPDYVNNRTIRFRQEDGTYSGNNGIGLTGGADTMRRGKFVAIFQIIQVNQSTGVDIASTRKFKEVETDSNDIDFSIDAGWRIIDGSTNSTQMAWINTENYFGSDRSKQMRSYVQVYKKMLRNLIVKRYSVDDVQVGEGGWGDRSATPRRRRNGGTTSFHPANSNDPGGGYRGYGGGAGGNLNQPRGVGRDDTDFGGVTNIIGSGGGSAFAFDANEADDNFSANEGGSNVTGVARSEPTVPYHAGSAGGGSVTSSGFTVGGATRSEWFTRGKTSRQRTGYQALADGYHGGRGYFGYNASAGNWLYFKNNTTDGTTQSYNGTDYYYYLTVNQFPYNASFAAGGGAGSTSSGSNGGNGSGGTGGAGGSGSTYSITGYSTVYANGGGGAGRFINGAPGNSQPADPSTQTVPSGAPNAPAYLPYGSGGGVSAGSQEGNGAGGGARLYHPGSGPWPSASPVSFGTAHMDTLRWKHADVPDPQKGDPGTAYSGKQGVVIISYNRSQFL